MNGHCQRQIHIDRPSLNYTPAVEGTEAQHRRDGHQGGEEG